MTIWSGYAAREYVSIPAVLGRLPPSDALDVVRGLTRADFHKSMTTHEDHRVWQDVYHALWRGKGLYVIFQQAGEYFVVSFKEL